VDAKAWLGVLWDKFAWLTLLINPVVVTVEEFCLVEPTQPVYPGDSVVVSAARDPVAFETIIQYLKDSAHWWVWSQLCQCNPSDTPGCNPTLDAHSSNLPTHFTPGSALALGMKFTVNTAGLTCFGVWIDSGTAQSVELIVYKPGEVFRNQTFVLIAGWNECIFDTPVSLINGNTYWCVARHAGGSGAYHDGYLHSSFTPAYSGGNLTYAGNIYQPWDLSSTNPDTGWDGVEPIVCVSSPVASAPAVPPAPDTTLPDGPAVACTTIADLCAIVNPVTQQLALLKQRLDLLQRRLLPFAWIPGATSSGLTGSGTISVGDALGCIVTLTAVPGTWGQTAASPRRLIPSVGSLQVTDGTNFQDEHQLHYDNQIVLFDAGWGTELHYSLRQGVTASIMILQPEP
jgi:hypothetical protein